MRTVTEDVTGFHAFKRGAAPESFPEDFAAYVASFGDVYWWPPGNFHVVTRRDLAQEALRSPAFSADRKSFFLTRMPELDLSLVQNFFAVVSRMMVMSDDGDHTRRRKAASIGFEDPVLDRFREEVRETVRGLLARAFEKDRFDFYQEVARHLPCTVLANLFCIPEADRQDFFEWSNVMTGFFGGGSGYLNEDGMRVDRAAKALQEYFTDLIARRRVEPGDDYVTRLLEGQERFGLSDEEVVSQATMMLVAGQVTTTDQLCNNVFLLLRTPGALERLRGDPARVPAAMEECTRFDPAVTFLFRVCREDTRLGDQEIRSGETLFLASHCLNRDLEGPDPGLLDLDRKPAQHFGYGFGPHFCLGARLGRMEMNTLVEHLVRDHPPIELDPEVPPVRDHYSLSFSGFSCLPVRMRES